MAINKFQVVKIIFFILAVVFGNLFLLLFVNSLKAEHLLTNSPFQIILSFIYPIVSFALFLCSILYFSIFTKNKYFWGLTCLLSFASYSFLIRFSVWNMVGGLVITSAIFFFLFSFHRFKIMINDKSSLVGQVAMSLTGATLVISIVIAFNFYSFYRTVLSQNNIIISNKLIMSNLSPVMRVYLDDLGLTDVNQTFSQYVTGRADLTKQPPSQIRNLTLTRLSIKSASDNQTMKDLIAMSFNNSILKIITEYQKKLPLLLSLGLGVITQTMMTVATFLAGICSFLLLRVLQRMKLLSLHTVDLKGNLLASLEK